MAWVRIHDGALDHPKIVGLSDRAFRLWVWGLSYAQMHLTDGRLPLAAVRRHAAKAVTELEQARLWSVEPDGWHIHDFLDWNDSKGTVRERQQKAKTRYQRYIQRATNAVGNEAITKPNQTIQEEPPNPLSVKGGKPRRLTRAERRALGPTYGPWECPHVERCGSRGACATMTALNRPTRAKAS